MRLAVVGCCHGRLQATYDSIKARGEKPDLVIICGDFQAIRDESDLASMAAPAKYRLMGDFVDYAQGGAPYLTLVIGGNHEASTHMHSLPHGGWLAPNIYYMGYAGVVQFRGLRIGGLSGIYHHEDYHKTHFERPPFKKSSLHSVYHVRQQDVQKLWLYGPQDRLDIMLSHDWPAGIEHSGNLGQLLRRKPFLEPDVNKGHLGSPPAMALLQHLQPRRWYSAHLHVYYPAQYQHGENTGNSTQFLALDKVLDHRHFLQFETIPDRSDSGLELDPRWLAIVKASLAASGALSPDMQLPAQSSFDVPAFGTDQTAAFLAMVER